jgi:hypothetical protein
MIELQIDNPIPKPPGFVVKKDSKIQSTFSGAKPDPESRTATSTSMGSCVPSPAA